MTKKTELAVLVSALVWAGAVGATTAAPVAADQQFARESVVRFDGATTIAKRGADDGADPTDDRGGRGGDDGVDPFDDHGVDRAPQGPTSIAKHGADDGPDPTDDRGGDRGRGRGGDDADDPCDDQGTDLCRNVA